MTQRITSLVPVSMITDESDRPWKFLEVHWVEEDALVSGNHPVALLLQTRRSAIIPVAVQFD